MTTRTASKAAALAELMRADVDGGSERKRRLYQGGEIDGGTMTQAFNRQFIKAAVGAVGFNLSEDNRRRVDLRDTQEVQARALEYVKACELANLIPSISGLCGYSLHCSRQWLHKFKVQNPTHETTVFLERVGELFADCLIQTSLAGASNAVMALFTLKNNHGYLDKVSVEDVTEDEGETALDVGEILKRYEAQ
ncbi:MAG: hypothetical protein IKK34_12890 [Clostridia bacterium]|nr:hypothetical protein [Clostridia bacterium]MBR3796905.1 hypothetical protein [Clostridia bacterium]